MNAAVQGQDVAKLEIEIVGGLHQGAKLSLNLGDYTVGSTSDADIVIRDPGVVAQHAILRVDRRTVLIEAVGGDVVVGDRTIAKGHGFRVRTPGTIAVANARLALSWNRDVSAVPEFFRPLATRPMAVAAGVAACALIFTVASRGVPVSPATPGPVTTAAMVHTTVTEDMVSEAAAKLKERLTTAGLTSVNIAAADKRVLVTGAVGNRDAAAITEAERWFDETYRGRIVLTLNVNVTDKLPAFRLQAVWYGERPYVVLEDGRHIFEGATMDNGWRIQRIADDRVVLNKDGQSLALTYNK